MVDLKIATFLLIVTVKLANCAKHIRPCYFTNWSQYRNGKGKYVPEDYEPGLCTHILFAFATMNEDFTVKAFDPADLPSDWQPQGMYSRVNALKNRDPQLKTLLSIGGFSFGTRLFKAMSKTAINRQVFIDSAIAFVRKHNFDGFDIDWEYPQGEEDKQLFSTLMKEARAAFSSEASRTGRERLLLTAAVSAGEGTISVAYDIPAIAPSLDFVLVMTYDFHGGWEIVTGLNSPLFKREDEIFWQQVWNTDWAANHWHEKGMPKEKIVIGIATYGRGWTLKDPNVNGIKADTSGPAKITKYVGESGVGAFYELCEMLAEPGATRVWHAEHEAPYFYNGNQWWGYDDEQSVRNKMRWLKSKGYGGAFVWTLDFDDFTGTCPGGGGEKYPLISIIRDELSDGSGTTPPQTTTSTTPSITTTTTSTKTTTTTTTRTTTTMSSTVATTRPTSTTTDTPTTSTVPPPIGHCSGKLDGFHSHPFLCHDFLLCSNERDYTISCPANFDFSPSKRYCVEKSATDCVVTTTTAATTTTTRTTPTTTTPTVTTTTSAGGVRH